MTVFWLRFSNHRIPISLNSIKPLIILRNHHSPYRSPAFKNTYGSFIIAFFNLNF